MKIILIFLILFCISCDCRPKLVREGEWEKVEYLQGNWSKEDQTIIMFKDGSTIVLNGHYNLHSKNILIYQQGHFNSYFIRTQRK